LLDRGLLADATCSGGAACSLITTFLVFFNASECFD
jgi:hypothetical protein